MKKQIKAEDYFIDIGIMSIIAILGFSIGVSKWVGIIGILWMTFFSMWCTVHLNNKKDRK